jgi:demethylspheroidene O-methyltransferase
MAGIHSSREAAVLNGGGLMLPGFVADLRNRILASNRFRQWAQRLPVFRGITQRRARSLFRITAGFVNSQVLSACLELELIEKLSARPASVAELAAACRLTPERMRRLLLAAESLAIVERRSGDTFGLGSHGVVLMADPGLAAMARHHKVLYRDLADPVALLRDETGGTGLGRLWPYAEGEAPAELQTDAVADYTELMGASQQMVAEQVLEAFSFDGFASLLDVGGGNGSFLSFVGARYPQLELRLFDLPGVTPLAERRLAAAGLADRSRILGGDFHRDELPGSQPLISLVRILHDHDDEPVQRLLASAHRALRSGGTLLVAEPMLGAPGAEDMGAAYFGFYLLAMGSGRPRDRAELQAMLRAAGFEKVRAHRTPLPLICSVISARKPN